MVRLVVFNVAYNIAKMISDSVECIAQTAGFAAARRCLLRSRPLLFVSFMPARVARCGG